MNNCIVKVVKISLDKNGLPKEERYGMIGKEIITNTELTAGEKVLLMYYSSFVNSKNGESTHLFKDKEVSKEMEPFYFKPLVGMVSGYYKMRGFFDHGQK